MLHALDDAGIPVDVIGGTSQGAFMAALYAQVRSSQPFRLRIIEERLISLKLELEWNIGICLR